MTVLVPGRINAKNEWVEEEFIDEINIIEPGRNYGWGVILSGVQTGIEKRAAERMEQPGWPAWPGSGCAAEVSGDTVNHQEVLFNQFGRARCGRRLEAIITCFCRPRGSQWRHRTPGSALAVIDAHTA
jgi:hypothetical protein